MSDVHMDHEVISRDDIRDKFRELGGDLGQTAEAARTPMLGAGIAAIGALAVAAFWLGRRRGRASRTVVEVRRV